jgi:ferredoxin, 2Fe-2S
VPIITCKKSGLKIQTEVGKTLMKALLDSGVPVASSCNGDGVCSKCRLQVIGNDSGLSRVSEVEAFLKEKFQIKVQERISCQALVLGDVEVDATYW